MNDFYKGTSPTVITNNPHHYSAQAAPSLLMKASTSESFLPHVGSPTTNHYPRPVSLHL
jgi:hypothetical protein